MVEPGALKNFRCDHCAAPLTPPPAGSTFVRCEYCGHHYQFSAPAPAPAPAPARSPRANPPAVQQAPERRAPQPPADPAAPSPYAEGTRVQILYGSTWYDGVILKARGTRKWRVRYDGYSSDWDQDMPEKNLRPAKAADAPPPAPKRDLKKGDAVEVHWGSSWYAATVLRPRDDGARIRYDGYGSGWDEDVPWDRIR